LINRSASEHVFTDSSVIVREDEPTSIIAFTLASKTYRDRLRSVAHVRRDSRRTDAATDSSYSHTAEESVSVTPTNLSQEDFGDADEALKREGGTHINYGTLVRCDLVADDVNETSPLFRY
jgi:1-phosphatidylinositol-3-phosphate 5-kinase